MAVKTWNGSTGTWATGGSWSPTGVPAAADTVVINAGTITVAAQTCAGITIGGNCTLAGTGLTCNGPFVINSGRTATFNMTAAFNVTGNITNSGTWNQGTSAGAITLNGATNQSVAWGTNRLNNVTINKPAGSWVVTFTGGGTLLVTASSSINSIFSYQGGSLNQGTTIISCGRLIMGSGTAKTWTMSAAVNCGVSCSVAGAFIDLTGTGTTFAQKNTFTINGYTGTNTVAVNATYQANVKLVGNVTWSIGQTFGNLEIDGSGTNVNVTVYGTLTSTRAGQRTYSTTNFIFPTNTTGQTINIGTAYGLNASLGVLTLNPAAGHITTYNLNGVTCAGITANTNTNGCTYNITSTAIGATTSTLRTSAGSRNTTFNITSLTQNGATATSLSLGQVSAASDTGVCTINLNSGIVLAGGVTLLGGIFNLNSTVTVGHILLSRFNGNNRVVDFKNANYWKCVSSTASDLWIEAETATAKTKWTCTSGVEGAGMGGFEYAGTQCGGQFDFNQPHQIQTGSIPYNIKLTGALATGNQTLHGHTLTFTSGVTSTGGVIFLCPWGSSGASATGTVGPTSGFYVGFVYGNSKPGSTVLFRTTNSNPIYGFTSGGATDIPLNCTVNIQNVYCWYNSFTTLYAGTGTTLNLGIRDDANNVFSMVGDASTLQLTPRAGCIINLENVKYFKLEFGTFGLVGAIFNIYKIDLNYGTLAGTIYDKGWIKHNSGTLNMLKQAITWRFWSDGGGGSAVRVINWSDGAFLELRNGIWEYTNITNFTQNGPLTNCGIKFLGSTQAVVEQSATDCSYTQVGDHTQVANVYIGKNTTFAAGSCVNSLTNYDWDPNTATQSAGRWGSLTTSNNTINVFGNLRIGDKNGAAYFAGGWDTATITFNPTVDKTVSWRTKSQQTFQNTVRVDIVIGNASNSTINFENDVLARTFEFNRGTINLNNYILDINKTFKITDTTNTKTINTGASPGAYSIYNSNSTVTDTVWSVPYANLLTYSGTGYVRLDGGIIDNGITSTKDADQPHFNLSTGTSAYTLNPSTDFRVGKFRINNYVVPTGSVWTVSGTELVNSGLNTGTLPDSFTVNFKTSACNFTPSTFTAWRTINVYSQVTLLGALTVGDISLNGAGATFTTGNNAVTMSGSATAASATATTKYIMANNTWTCNTTTGGGFKLSGTLAGVQGTSSSIVQFTGTGDAECQLGAFSDGTTYGGTIKNSIPFNGTTGYLTVQLDANLSNFSTVDVTSFQNTRNPSGWKFIKNSKGITLPSTGFGISGAAGALVKIVGSGTGNSLYNVNANTNINSTSNYLDVANMALTGATGTTWFLGGNSVDSGGNTGVVLGTSPTYNLTRSATNINEGSSVTITLNTTNVNNGTVVAYTLLGISALDYVPATVSGSFTVNNNTATTTVTAAADNLTEGEETFTLRLNNLAASIAVIINDTSLSPTYSLSRSVASVNEGSNFTITLNTTNVANGTLVPYTISGTGITTADINGASLTGNFTVNSNTASIIFTTTLDFVTEGTETFTLSLNNGLSSVSVDIVNVLNPTYALVAAPTSLNEGGNVTITLNTTDVPNGTLVPYTISGTGITTADINGASLTGNFTVNSNTASLVLIITGDYLTEGNETLRLTLNSIGTFVDVTLVDFYKTRTFSLSSNKASVYEGENFTITLNTTNVFDGSLIPYTISGSGITTADINGASLTGNFTVNSNTATLLVQTSIDAVEEVSETFTITLGSPASGNISVTILDRPKSAGNFFSFFV
jgi:hypothetical protein